VAEAVVAVVVEPMLLQVQQLRQRQQLQHLSEFPHASSRMTDARAAAVVWMPQVPLNSFGPLVDVAVAVVEVALILMKAQQSLVCLSSALSLSLSQQQLMLQFYVV
jgi:hypothetical protein